MLLSLEFNGYRFFNDSCLSFVADGRTKKLLSNSVELDGKNVLKSIGLYGSNNSGKTNITVLFNLLKMVLEGRERLSFNNFIFDDPKKTSISIVFNNMNDNGWLKYEFVYDNENMKYISEKLAKISYYESGNVLSNIIFEKNNENKLLKVFDEDKSKYLSIIPSRLPFLYSIELNSGDFSPLKEYLDELQKLANSIEIIKMYDIPYENTLETMKNNNNNKIKFIKEFVRNADIEINDFEYDSSITLKFQNDIDEESLKRLEKNIDSYKLVTTYGNKKVPSIIFDSTGTKKIEAIASYIYDALTEGKILVVDELDNGLHYKLTRSIVSVFNNMLNTKSQLLFATHDLLLIDCNTLMRKDQIYFVNRNKCGVNLYCLKESKTSNGGPREVSDIIKHYNRGEFGAVPNPSFINLIIEVLDNDNEEN